MKQRKVYEIVRIARRRDPDYSETDITLSIMEGQRESPERLVWLEEASAQEIADWIIDQFKAYNAEMVEAVVAEKERTRRAAERQSDSDTEPELNELEAAHATIERLTVLLQQALETLESRESVGEGYFAKGEGYFAKGEGYFAEGEGQFAGVHNLIADIRRELETAADEQARRNRAGE